MRSWKSVLSKGVTVVLVVLVPLTLLFLWVVLSAVRTQEPHPRTAQRQHDLRQIADAIIDYTTEHEGRLPPGIPADSPKEICAWGSSDCDGYVDLLPKIFKSETPYRDPSFEFIYPHNTKGTGYFVLQDPVHGTITVSAPLQSIEPPPVVAFSRSYRP